MDFEKTKRFAEIYEVCGSLFFKHLDAAYYTECMRRLPQTMPHELKESFLLYLTSLLLDDGPSSKKLVEQTSTRCVNCILNTMCSGKDIMLFSNSYL